MGKGRAPCCDKNKVKRGPWSPQEDLKLITFIQKHGHQNWRSLPKQAGLVRCGKSCRLRWINYLRPDLKRGNFTKEEEDNIINLHHTLGNKWSKIASELPGRTDNEIKNVWHTHLKKKLLKKNSSSDHNNNTTLNTDHDLQSNNNKQESSSSCITSPSSSSSSSTNNNNTSSSSSSEDDGLVEIPLEADHDFWKAFLDDDKIGTADQTESMKYWIREIEKDLGLLETQTSSSPSHDDDLITSIGLLSDDMDIWPNAAASGF